MIDQQVFNFLNSFAGSAAWFDSVVVFFGKWFPYIVVLGAVLFVARSDSKKKIRTTIVLFLPSMLGELVDFVIRQLYNRPRPFEVLSHAHQIISHAGGGSFPSSHTVFFVALATAIYFWKRSWSVYFFLAAFFIAISRVIGGIHWPLDIVGGIFVGIFAAMFIRRYIDVTVS